MTAGRRAIEYRRLRAPQQHGEILIEPPLALADHLVAENVERRRRYQATLAGMPLADLAQQARRELLDAAWRYTSAYRDLERPPADGPILLAGHQPQLFHPGVWFKNFVLGRLARRVGGVAVNLVIDNDTLRTASLRVPGGSLAAPTAEAVSFDAAGPESPFETRKILDREVFESFGERAARQIAPLVADPLVRELWPLVVERSRQIDNLGLCLAQGRHCLEGRWGLETFELPQSHVCRTGAFQRFAAHLLIEAPRLRETYNAAVDEYRRAHKIRSSSHPVPDLARVDDWIETPLWIWRDDDPRRRQLFVRRSGTQLMLSDRRRLEAALPCRAEGSYDDLVEALAALDSGGVRLRTRALTTTLWARLVQGDLFLHGIGGAKYDEVTDVLCERFFGVTPPTYLTVTATLKLPIAASLAAPADLRQVEQQLRALTYHPEQHIDASQLKDEAARRRCEQAGREKAAWVATPQTRENARQRCRAIRAANESLQPCVADRRQSLLEQRASLGERLAAAQILSSREYSFCLHPERTLRNFMLEFASQKP